MLWGHSRKLEDKSDGKYVKDDVNSMVVTTTEINSELFVSRPDDYYKIGTTKAGSIFYYIYYILLYLFIY